MSIFIYKRILKNIIIAIKINNKFHLHKLLSLYSIAICVIRCKTWWAPHMVTPGGPRRWQRSTLESMGAASVCSSVTCVFFWGIQIWVSFFVTSLIINKFLLFFCFRKRGSSTIERHHRIYVRWSFHFPLCFFMFLFFLKKIIYFTLCAYLFNQFFNFIWSDPVYR